MSKSRVVVVVESCAYCPFLIVEGMRCEVAGGPMAIEELNELHADCPLMQVEVLVRLREPGDGVLQ